MKVAILTLSQYNELNGAIYDDCGSRYNPVLDADGVYVISAVEITNTTQPAFMWVKQLPLSDYKAPPTPPIPL